LTAFCTCDTLVPAVQLQDNPEPLQAAYADAEAMNNNAKHILIIIIFVSYSNVLYGVLPQADYCH
jgi:hypothetical protein